MSNTSTEIKALVPEVARHSLDVILLDPATGQTTTKSKNGLPVFGGVAQATRSSVAPPID